MNVFRYQAIENGGSSVSGTIEAEDRYAALRELRGRGLFASGLELCEGGESAGRVGARGLQVGGGEEAGSRVGARGLQFGQIFKGRATGKSVSGFTRQMSALLGASIPIPQALDTLGEEEENPGLKAILLGIAEAVRKGASFSAALEAHPRLFNTLYTSMVRVGEEAGALPKVMTELADLLEHEDEVRGEVAAAVAYPVFVLGFGMITVTVLLTVVLPRLFTMLQEI